jgi:3-phosphoshikimate 1-carboxyvinyltransferase
MNLVVHPSKALRGELTLPGDKSLSHRAALFAALADGESCIDHFQDSGVTRTMLDALGELGVEWSLEGSRLWVRGQGFRSLRPPQERLNCGSSATTLRLLVGALAATGLPAVLDGSPSLRRRPMGRILKPLHRMGVRVDAVDTGFTPLKLSARAEELPLRGIEYTLPIASAQVKSCLLLAGLAAGEPLILHEPAPSRDHTERMLRSMGCRVESVQNRRHASSTVTLYPSHLPLQPLKMLLPGDISSASFLIAAALITQQSQIILRNIGLNPTRTGILDAFRAMGADLSTQFTGEQGGEPFGDIFVRSSELSGALVEGEMVVRMIDEFPIFAVTACFAKGITRVRDAGELRYKESDRISALCRELRLLGANVTETEDGFSIHGPCPLHGGIIDPHSDHRLAMAFGVAGLSAREPVGIHKAEIIHESFPEYATMLQDLGARIELEGNHGS